MTTDNFHEKISLFLSFLILNNYLIIGLNFPLLLIKINFLLFLLAIIVFYLNNIAENHFLKIFFALIVIISLGTPLVEWDARSVWLFHAKRIFFDNSIFSVADNYAEFSHNDYPGLAPAFAASLANLIGYWNEVFPKLSFLLMYLPPLILISIFLKDTHYLIFLSILFFTVGKYLFNGWADGLLAVYFGSSAFLMYLIIIDESKTQNQKLFYYFIAVCFFISLTLIKNEGIALLLILFIVTFIIKLYKKELKKNIFNLFLLSFSFIPILLWKYFCYSKGLGNEFFSTSTLPNLTERLYDIKNYQLISYFLFLNEKFLIALALFLVSFWTKRNNELFAFVLIISIIYIFILFFIYLSTPYDFYYQLNATSTRVIKSLSFLLAFFGLYNLSSYKFR